MKKDEKEYYNYIEKAKAVFEKKSVIQSITIQELTIICKPLKRKQDNKLPTQKVELIQKYNEWKGRPVPSFDVSEYETNVDEDNTTSIDNKINTVEI